MLPPYEAREHHLLLICTFERLPSAIKHSALGHHIRTELQALKCLDLSWSDFFVNVRSSALSLYEAWFRILSSKFSVRASISVGTFLSCVKVRSWGQVCLSIQKYHLILSSACTSQNHHLRNIQHKYITTSYDFASQLFYSRLYDQGILKEVSNCVLGLYH